MAQRLPVPGSDDNTWGDLLNGFLQVSLNGDGTLKTGLVTTNEISSSAGILKAQLATTVQASLTSADSAVHLSGAETIAGIKTFSSSPSVPAPTNSNDAATKAYVDSAVTGGGGMTRIITQVTAATSAGSNTNTDYVYWWSGSTSYLLTMPTAVSNTNRYTLKNSSVASQPVNTTSSQTIEGGTSITISSGNSVDLISNGSNWMVI